MAISRHDFQAWLWYRREHDAISRNDARAAVTDILSPQWTKETEERVRQLMNAYGISDPEEYFKSLEHRNIRANFDIKKQTTIKLVERLASSGRLYYTPLGKD